jgi:hypothetical protein
VLLTLFSGRRTLRLFAHLFLQIWVLKYCYVLIEQLADGATEPPVMSTDMLSPLRDPSWAQLGIIIAGRRCAWRSAALLWVLARCCFLLLPASIAVLGVGEPFYQAVNPLTLLAHGRGLGPYYLAHPRIASRSISDTVLFWRFGSGHRLNAAVLICQLSFFSLIGGFIFLRASTRLRAAAAAPSAPQHARSRAREAARQDARRCIPAGAHRQTVEATRPLAQWLGTSMDRRRRGRAHVASQALGWDNIAGPQHHRQHAHPAPAARRRPDAALAIFDACARARRR